MTAVRFVLADITVPGPDPHGRGFRTVRVGWLPDEGWFCTCETRGRCEHIRAALAVVSEEGK